MEFTATIPHAGWFLRAANHELVCSPGDTEQFVWDDEGGRGAGGSIGSQYGLQWWPHAMLRKSLDTTPHAFGRFACHFEK
jgi:hypothetical protein